MYYCYSIKQGLFDDEMQYAKDIGVYLFYDQDKDEFFDKDGTIINIDGKNIFPRTGALQANALIDAIIRHHGNSKVHRHDYNTTLNWPHFIKTKRNNIIMSGKQILENPDYIISLFGTKQIFFKTKNKNYSGIIEVKELIDEGTPIYQTIKYHEEDDFIISDVVDILSDKFGPLEYRCFVVDGTILNVSRVHDYLLNEIPKNIIDELQNYIDALNATDFPKSYVIDIFEYKDKNDENKIDILECNPIIASGTFLYNSVFLKKYDIKHSDPEKSIPQEKIVYGPSDTYGYNVPSNPRASICYNLPGGFASDLISITMFGKTTNSTFLHIDTVGSIDFSKTKEIKFTPIENDSLSCEPISLDETIKRLNKEYQEKNK